MAIMRRDRARVFDPALFDAFEDVVRVGGWSTNAATEPATSAAARPVA
jgi:hypothetical protein